MAAAAILVLVVLFVLQACIFKPSVPVNSEAIITENTNLISMDTSSTVEISTTTTSTTGQNGTYKKPVTKTAPGAVTQSYADALKEYSASGYRFQFVNCRATPGSLTIKKGTSFMIDNRDNASHKIKVGPATYSVGAYGFVIATAKTIGSNYIICDGISTGRLEVRP